MPSDTPRRLRRTPLGGGPPPPEALTRAGLVPDVPPIEVDPVDPQVRRGSSNTFMDKAAGTYKDLASQPKPASGLVNSKGPTVLGKK